MAETDSDTFLSERGFERVVEAGKPVYYNTPGPMPRILYKRDHVQSYIEREKKAGRPTAVTEDMFRFTKKRSKSNVFFPDSGAGDVALDQTSLQPDLPPALEPSLQSDLEQSLQPSSMLETTVSRLAKVPGAKVNHRKDLCRAASELVQSF